ncbi:MAG: hypothetical protein J7K88_08000 [Candidatus Fermentibacteraceae bacterium]|nr:hypothetical protein [Candidatus Fermentibacteraceae bacterium]
MKTAVLLFIALAFSGQALGSVLVSFACDAQVVEVGEYDETSEILNVTLRVEEVTENHTGHDTDYFMESYGEQIAEVSLENVSPEEAGLICSGCVVELDYRHASGLFGSGSEPRAFSSENWEFVEILQEQPAH